MVKGEPVILMERASQNRTSETGVDCSKHNALCLEVTVTGTSPSATLTVLGSPAEQGTYQAVFDPNGVRTPTGSAIYYVSIGPHWAKVQLSSLSGTFQPGEGFTIVATPFLSPGPTLLRATIL